jgi:CubicO group peptidase (beta-lactamase class C family)
MTSFLIGMLVDEQKLNFTDQLPKALQRPLSEDLSDITVIDLLTHRSGLPDLSELENWGPLASSKEPTSKIRASLVDAILFGSPKFPRDSRFEYCNSNYVLLGEIIEKGYGKSWEQVISEKIFSQLGMKECGFGPAATKDLVPPDQPWGHKLVDNTVRAVQPKTIELEPSDNPAALGPAGTVSCSFDSWSLFLEEMLAAAQGHSSLLKPATAKVLFDVYKDNVAGGGWGCVDRDWANGPIYMMVGSNELNYAMYIIAPMKSMILMGATNFGAESSLVVLSEQIKLLAK